MERRIQIISHVTLRDGKPTHMTADVNQYGEEERVSLVELSTAIPDLPTDAPLEVILAYVLATLITSTKD